MRSFKCVRNNSHLFIISKVKAKMFTEMDHHHHDYHHHHHHIIIIISKLKAKMFEEMESQGERDREAQVRKEEFQKKKEMFKEGEEEMPCSEKPAEDKENGEVTKKKAVFESLEEGPPYESKSEEKSSECDSPARRTRSAESAADEEMTEALERERRREQFLEKQTLFAK